MTLKSSTLPDESGKRSYTSPFVRDPGSVPQRWRFEERDQAMLVAVYEHDGMLTTCQLEALFFAPNRPTNNLRSAKRSCMTRCQYLFHRSYLDRLQIPSLGSGRSTIVNILYKAGIDEVTRQLGLDRATVDRRPKLVKNKPSSHLHSLLVNDVRIVIERVDRSTDLTLKSWIGERALKSKTMRDKLPFLTTGHTRLAKKAPDSAFFLEYPTEEYTNRSVTPVGFFLEVDRGTENNRVWAEKVRAYEQFRRSGLSRQYYGVANFRVLVTVSSQRRLENLIKTTLKAGGRHYYWFTLQENIDIFQPWKILADIWRVVGWTGQYSLKSLTVKPKE